MSGELQTTQNDQGKGLSPAEMFKVMSDTLYPGAQRESILMVLEYCRARNLDPILKPVHIVPMYCSTGKKDSKGYDIKAMRDVVMPGIGSYRITAARTKQCAGVSEPEFGEDVTEEFDGVKVTFPKWCKVTVKRKIGADVIAEFSAIEYWKENYATKGKGNPQPNAMWEKRPYGQISKCAEAQALRKAFPEVGSEPTADEMEGKEIDVTPQQIKISEEVKQVEFYSDDDFIKNSEKWENIIKSGKKTADDLIAFIGSKATLTEDQREEIKSWEIQDANA